MEQVNENDECNENQNCQEDPQPQQRRGLVEQEGCELERACNGLGPCSECNVLNGAFGFTLALKELAVEDLEDRQSRAVDLIADRLVIGIQYKRIGQRLFARLIGLGLNQLTACGCSCKNLTVVYGNGKLYGIAVSARALGAVDGVRNRLCFIGNGYVYVGSGHLDLVVGHSNGLAVCVNHVQLCGVAVLCNGSQSNFCPVLAGCGSSRYVAVGDYAVDQLACLNSLHGCGGSADSGSPPLVCFSCNLGNCGSSYLFGIVLGSNALDLLQLLTGLILEDHGIADEIPLCVTHHICLAEICGIKTDPCTGCGILCGVSGLCGSNNICKALECNVLVGCLIFLSSGQLAVYIVVDVIYALAQGYVDRNSALNGEEVVFIVGLVVCLDLDNLVSLGNLKRKLDLCACGEVEASVKACKLTVNVLARLGLEGKGQENLVCNNVIGEVSSLERYVCGAVLCCFYNSLCQLAYAVCNGVYVGLFSYLIDDRAGIRQLDCHSLCKLIVACSAVCENIKGIELCTLCLCIVGVCKCIGYACLCGISEYNVFLCSVVKICKGCIGDLEEIIVAVCNMHSQRNDVSAVCASQQMCTVEIEVEALGKNSIDGQHVCAVLFGYVIIDLCIEREEVVGNCLCNQRSVLGNFNCREYQTLVCIFLVGPANAVAVIKLLVDIGGKGYLLCDLCNCISMHCERIAAFHQNGTDQVTVLIFKLHLDEVTVCINHSIGTGHCQKRVALGIGPRLELVAGYAGIVLEYVEVCALGQECAEQRLVAFLCITCHVLDLVQILETNGKVKAYGDALAAVDTVHDDRNCVGVEVQLAKHLVQCLAYKLLGIEGYASRAGCKYAVTLVCICEADIHCAVGNQLGLCENIILYLIISIGLGCCLVNSLLIKLVNGVSIKNCSYVNANLCGNDIGNGLGDRSILCSVNDVSRGDCGKIDAESALDLIKDLLNSGDLFSLVYDRVCLDRKRFNVSEDVLSGLVFNDLGNTLCAGNVCGFVYKLVKGDTREIVAEFCLDLIENQSNILVIQYGVVECGRLNRIKNGDDLFKRESTHKAFNLIAVEVNEVKNLNLQFIGNCIQLKCPCVKRGQLGGNGYVKNHNAVFDSGFINISMKNIGELCGCVLQTAEVALNNKLKGNALGLLSCGTVNSVGQIHGGGEVLAVLNRCELIKSGDHARNSLYKCRSIDVEQSVNCVLGCNNVSVNCYLIYIKEQLVGNHRENGTDVLLYIDELNQLDQLVVVELCEEHVHGNEIEQIAHRNSLHNAVEVNVISQNLCIGVCVDAVDQGSKVKLCNKSSNINIIGSLFVAAEHADTVVETQLANQHVKCLCHGLHVTLQSCAVNAVHLCNDLRLVYNNDVVFQQQVGVKNTPSEHFTCVDLVLLKQLFEVYTTVGVYVSFPHVCRICHSLKIVDGCDLIESRVCAGNIVFKNGRINVILKRNTIVRKDLCLGRDLIKIIIDITVGHALATRSRCAIYKNDQIGFVVVEFNRIQTPIKQIVNSDLVILEKLFIIKLPFGRDIILPLVQGIDSSLVNVCIEKCCEFGILGLNF